MFMSQVLRYSPWKAITGPSLCWETVHMILAWKPLPLENGWIFGDCTKPLVTLRWSDNFVPISTIHHRLISFSYNCKNMRMCLAGTLSSTVFHRSPPLGVSSVTFDQEGLMVFNLSTLTIPSTPTGELKFRPQLFELPTTGSVIVYKTQTTDCNTYSYRFFVKEEGNSMM